jgi:hypothetical protein
MTLHCPDPERHLVDGCQALVEETARQVPPL